MIAAIVGADLTHLTTLLSLKLLINASAGLKTTLLLTKSAYFLRNTAMRQTVLNRLNSIFMIILKKLLIQFLPALTVLYLLLGFTATDARLKTLMPQVCSLTLGLKQAKQNLYVRLLREFASI